MPVAAPPATAAPPDDPLLAALTDPAVAAELLAHARLWLSRRGGVDLAEDAVQETTCRALKSKSQFDPTRSPAAWLHRILLNVMRELSRSKVRHAAVATVENLQIPVLADEPPLTKEEVAALMSQLPAPQRELIRLHYYEDLNHIEMAAIYGISDDNSRTRLARAMAMLRRLARAEGVR